MEWLDNLKEEIAWPYVQAKNWLASADNQTGMWITVIVTAVAALFVYGGLFFGGRAIARAVSDDAIITVVSDNPCLTGKGLVKEWAPPACYDSGHKHVIAATPSEDERITAMTRNNDATTVPKSEQVYNPPCKKDGLPGCTDIIYGKRLLSGIIVTTTFHNDELLTGDGHLQPDYTEIEIDPCNGDSCDNVKEKLCGNVLDDYIPGHKLKLVLNESKQADYDGCYVTNVVQLTFNGNNVRRGK